jgi:peptidoglycan/xylan/chitin deacetylase (PgdA/CDA1 family)
MSKLIISHDVDHLSVWEHISDGILPKFLVRALIEFSKGVISLGELYARSRETVLGQWQFSREVARFDSSYGIKSTFFFGAAKGIGLSYNLEDAVWLAHELQSLGHDLAIHGIARKSLVDIIKERERFESLIGSPCSGMRFHYLFPDESILPLLDQAGFSYDSSLRGSGSTKRVENLIHFPVHIMDSDVFCAGKPYQSRSRTAALNATREKISLLVDQGTDYISLLFHDRYFSPAHQSWHDWYVEVIAWIVEQGLVTCSYQEALSELRVNVNF